MFCFVVAPPFALIQHGVLGNVGGNVCVWFLQANLLCIIWSYPPGPPPDDATHHPSDTDLDDHTNTYRMTSPYIPPQIQIFYQQPPQAENGEQTFIENKERPYSFFEAFYSEPPMTHEETYPSPTKVYEAKDEHSKWVDYYNTQNEDDSSGADGSVAEPSGGEASGEPSGGDASGEDGASSVSEPSKNQKSMKIVTVVTNRS